MNDNTESKKQEFEYFVLPQYIESWIQGYPLKSKYGFIRPVKIKDYFKYIGEIDFLKKQGWEVERLILKELNGKDEDMLKMVKKDFDNSSFLTCVKNNVAGLREIYNNIFSIFIHDFNPKGFYWSITQGEFDDLRRLILDFNHVPYHEKNSNPEIERGNQRKNHIASAKGGVIEFDTVYSTLMTKEGGGYLPEEINNLTMRQFYLAFNRVEFNKANEMTILFKTVDSKDSIKVIDWNKSFREKEDEIIYGSIEDIKKNNVFLKK